MVLHPSERAERLSFDGDACLYRDHLGRRVVCDVMGAGRYRIDASVTWVAEADERPAASPGGTFGESLLVAAEGPGDISVWANLGPDRAGLLEPGVVADHVLGAGWVVGAVAQVDVDGATGWPPPTPDMPIPFVWRARSIAPMRVVRSEVEPELADRFEIGDPQSLSERGWSVQNMSEVVPWSALDEEGMLHEAFVASHLNAAQWRSPIPKGRRGLILARCYDRFHGRQRARVLVDGRFVGWWYSAVEDRQRRWGRDWFGFTIEPRDEAASIEIVIDPPAGAPLWSVSSYELWAL